MKWLDQNSFTSQQDFKPKAFSLNTPGSDVDREVRVDLDLEGETKVVNLRTPGKELKFEVSQADSILSDLNY